MKGGTRKRGKTWSYYFDAAPVGGKRKKIEKGGFRTKKEAESALAKAMAEYDEPTLEWLGELRRRLINLAGKQGLLNLLHKHALAAKLIQRLVLHQIPLGLCFGDLPARRLADLPEGGVVATGSLRRICQLNRLAASICLATCPV